MTIPPSNEAPPRLEVRDLRVTYGFGGRQAVEAVRGISFRIPRGSVVGLVGESGSGKSSVARCLVKLAPIQSGEILYDGRKIGALSTRDFFPWRKRIQMIFQDPFTSLNPMLTVEQIVAEPLRIHHSSLGSAERRERVHELLKEVGLEAEAYAQRRPGELSGGQRQRVGIARALAVDPELLICDEPVSALDVSIQAQIINLLRNLRESHGLSLLFIAHDLAVVENISDEILVMRRGEIVERGPAATLICEARHPYTRELMAAAPQL